MWSGPCSPVDSRSLDARAISLPELRVVVFSLPCVSVFLYFGRRADIRTGGDVLLPGSVTDVVLVVVIVCYHLHAFELLPTVMLAIDFLFFGTRASTASTFAAKTTVPLLSRAVVPSSVIDALSTYSTAYGS